jgi:hypothetical protein
VVDEEEDMVRTIAMVMGLVLAASGAQATVLCQSKAGALFARTACKKKETVVDPAALGLRGAKGDKGDPGTSGTNGTNGTPGTLTVLPSGQSESGMFSAGGANPTEADDYIGAGITFPQPLAQPIADANIIDVQGDPGTTAPHCSGPGHADPGYLCLYNTVVFHVEPGYGYSDDVGYFSTPSVGVVLYWHVNGTDAYVGGKYTVTAP